MFSYHFNFKKSEFALNLRKFALHLCVWAQVFALAFPSPAHAMRESGIKMSPKMYDQLRAELRTNGWAYDYELIPDQNLRTIARKKELEAKDIFLKYFDHMLVEVGNPPQDMSRIMGLLRNVLNTNLPKKMEDGNRKWSDSGYASRVTTKKIEEILLDRWKMHEIENVLKNNLTGFLRYILDFKLLYSGFQYGQNTAVTRILERVDWDNMMENNLTDEGLFTAAYLPDYFSHFHNHNELKRIDWSDEGTEAQRIKESSQRILVTGVVFYFDPKDADYYVLQQDEQSYKIPNQPVWVLPTGLMAINMGKATRKFKDVSTAIRALVTPPDDFEEGRANGKYDLINPNDKEDDFRSELRAKHVAYDYQGITDGKNKAFVLNQREKIEAVQGQPLDLSFSGVDLNNDKDPLVKTLLLSLHNLSIYKFFERGQMNGEAAIPVMENDPKEVALGNEKVDLSTLRLTRWRRPVAGILFFYEPSRTLFHHVQLGDRIYEIPAKAPVWTFDDGLLAVNVGMLQTDIRAIIHALEGSLTVPPKGHVWGTLPLRSELRLAPAKPAKSFVMQLPSIPNIKTNEALKVMEALGINPHRDALLIERPFIETPEGLAITLTAFAKSQVHFVVMGFDPNDPAIQALNRSLEVLHERPLVVAEDAGQAIDLLRAQLQDAGRATASLPNYNLRAILSPGTPIRAEALKKQLVDVSFMTLNQFSQTALGMADRLGIHDFVSQLQTNIVNQFFITQSA